MDESADSILIVEDERLVALDLQTELRSLGYDAYAVASTGEQAIAIASERCPDLVLMDIRIEGARDGIEVAAILRERFDVPVVFLTAHSDEATLARAKAIGPSGFLTKPVQYESLRTTMEVARFKHASDRELRERERWSSTTLASIADAVVTVDLAGRVTFMNAAAEALTGQRLSDALGRPATDVVQLFEGAAPIAEHPLDAALRTRMPAALPEGSLRDAATGARRTVADTAAPVLDGARALGAVMVFRDVSEAKEAQKRLELSDRLVSLGTLAAGVAHEINNPLAALQLCLELLATGKEAPESVRDLHAEALGAAERIRRIVADLQTFARPGTRPDIGAGVREAVTWASRMAAPELKHRAAVVLELGETPPVDIDEAKLGQVLVNLLVNAAHAIPAGDRARNSVTVTTAVQADGTVSITVADTGVGMSPEVLSRVFEPFYTTKEIGSGTGLGLSICHGIVAAAGGSIELASEPGRGTTATVRLRPARSTAERKRVVAASRPQPASAAFRVLLVDDEPMMLRAMRRVLLGHLVEVAESGRQALEIVARESFDVIVSDVMMPDMTGAGFYEALLLQRPELAERTVFVTGGAYTTGEAAFLRSAQRPVLEKPIASADLRRIVVEVATARRGA